MSPLLATYALLFGAGSFLILGAVVAAAWLAWREARQPCIGCHTHHLPGHDCDGQPLDKTRETP